MVFKHIVNSSQSQIVVSIAASVCLVIGLLLVFFLVFLGPDRLLGATGTKAFWHTMLRTAGAAPTAAIFSLHNHHFVPIHYRHVHAHWFGMELYKLRLPVSACSTTLNDGCAHEYHARFFHDYGVTSLKDMLAHCDSDPKRQLCVHGVGHAIQSTESVASEGLNYALEMCSQADSDHDEFDCSDGVVMEYFMHNFESGSYIVEQSELGLYGGCDSVFYRPDICYYWLPRWWIKQEHKPGDSVEQLYAMLADRCVTVKETVLRESCIKGIGFSFHYVDILDIDTMQALCRKLNASAHEQTICLDYAQLLANRHQSFF